MSFYFRFLIQFITVACQMKFKTHLNTRNLFPGVVQIEHNV